MGPKLVTFRQRVKSCRIFVQAKPIGGFPVMVSPTRSQDC